MAVAVITGSAGLIGAEAARFFAGKGLDIVGIDNDMRRQFFGEEASNGLEPATPRDRAQGLPALRCRHPRSKRGGGSLRALSCERGRGYSYRGAALA